MSTKRILAVDCDDVLLGCNQALAPFHNRMYGTNLTYEDITTHYLPQIYGVSQDVMNERIFAFYESPEHAGMIPEVGAVEGIDALIERGWTLHMVTSRPVSVRRKTEALIQTFFPEKFEELHFTGCAVGTETGLKASICVHIGAVGLIDDAPKYAEEVLNVGIRALLPTRPWNQTYTRDGLLRFTLWNEVPKIAETLITIR